MALYQLSNLKMKEIKEEVFAKEKQLQELIEENLESLFNLDFVASEFTVGNFRLDTVAYNSDTKSFVIIEYMSRAIIKCWFWAIEIVGSFLFIVSFLFLSFHYNFSFDRKVL